MDWKKIKNEEPLQGKKCLVWRSKRRNVLSSFRYMVAEIQVCIDAEKGPEKCWVTEHRSCHEILSEDAWMYFEPYGEFATYS